MLTNIVETKLNSELLPGERLLWSGQPRQGLRLQWADLFLVPFSLVWGGAVLLGVTSMVLSSLSSNEPGFLFGLVFLIPFVLAAVYITVGRFGVDAYARRRTYYGLTDQRIIIVAGIFRRHLRVLNLRTLTEVQLSLGRQGRGTLTFGGASGIYGALPSGWPGVGRYGPAAFEGIEDARAVYEQLHAAQAKLLMGG